MVVGSGELASLRDIRTVQSSMRRKAVSRLRSSAYLDLYMLRKEKDRLEKELDIIDKRKTSIQKRLDDIHREMNRLEKTEIVKRQSKHIDLRKSSGKDWKTLQLKY
jgi:predicted  nucleic acid-binding Zn-ribbon protein